jgi:hypothetical protein
MGFIMNYPALSKFLYGGAAAVACAFSPSLASADDGVTAAVEVGANVVMSDLSDDDSLRAVGPAVALRLGYSVYGSTVRLTPEAKFSFESPGTPRAGAFMGGARLNFLGAVSPAIFGHAGGLVGDLRGFVWDAGAGLDFILNPTIDLGFYGAFYQSRGSAYDFGNTAWSDRNKYEWLQFGAQAAIHF